VIGSRCRGDGRSWCDEEILLWCRRGGHGRMLSISEAKEASAEWRGGLVLVGKMI
jgi:hypothetical protein